MTEHIWIGEASGILRVPKWILRRLAAQGHVPAARYPGGRWRFRRCDLPIIQAKLAQCEGIAMEQVEQVA